LHCLVCVCNCCLAFCEQATFWDDNDICLVLISTVVQYTKVFFHSSTVNSLLGCIIGTKQSFAFPSWCRVLRHEEANTYCTVFGFDPTQYRTDDPPHSRLALEPLLYRGGLYLNVMVNCRFLAKVFMFVDMYLLYYFTIMVVIFKWCMLSKARIKFRLKLIPVLFFHWY